MAACFRGSRYRWILYQGISSKKRFHLGSASIFSGNAPLLKELSSIAVISNTFPSAGLASSHPCSLYYNSKSDLQLRRAEIYPPYLLMQQVRGLSMGNSVTESRSMSEVQHSLNLDTMNKGNNLDANQSIQHSVAGSKEISNARSKHQLATLNHGFTFGQLFSKYNTSINKLQGSTIQCSVQRLPRDMVLVDTGLKTPMTFFKHELALPENKQQAKLKFGIQAVEEYDEPKLLMPKILEKKIRRKQIWTELHNIWQNKGMVEGTILNNVKGGFAVGLGGFVAFMPRSLRRGKKLKKTTFRILTMKEANLNIVLREVQTEKKLMTWSKLFSMRKNAQPVEGFVLQRISDGYLVRIAGHDAFLPHAYRRSRRLETKFHIVSMNARNLKIIVREAGGITPSSLFSSALRT